MPSTAFARQYSDRQRAAVVYAVLDSGKPLGGKRVAKLAAAGELPGPYHDLEPFIISARYVQHLAAAERRRRDGQGASRLAQAPPRDAARAIVAQAFDVIAEDLAIVKRKRKGERAAAMAPILKATREALALQTTLDPQKPGRKTEPEPTRDEPKPQPRKRQPTPAETMADRIRTGSNGQPRTHDESIGNETSVSSGHEPEHRHDTPET